MNIHIEDRMQALKLAMRGVTNYDQGYCQDALEWQSEEYARLGNLASGYKKCSISRAKLAPTGKGLRKMWRCVILR